jgi:hypothetical protein
MSDPQPARIKRKPPRAEPLQPDAPGKGRHPEHGGRDQDPGSDQQSEFHNSDEQSSTALKNVKDGYR